MAEPTNAEEFVGAFQEHMTKAAKRVQNLVDSFAVSPADPPMAATPKDIVWKRGKAQLFRYRRQTDYVYPVPYVMVPWLGISKTNVLDMLPGNSFIEFLVKQGYDVYLLDWGDIDEEDKDLGFDEAVGRYIPRAIERALEESGAREVTLNGICLGGTMSASYLALNPDAPVRNLVTIVSPINFDEGGLYKVWLDERYFPVDLIVERFGGIPANLMASAFKMLRPTLDAEALSGLWINLDNPSYTTSFKAMNRWANDYIGMPGKFFSQLAKDLYFKNKLLKGQFVLNGKPVDLKKITHPLLVVAARQDYVVPPLSAKGLVDAVSSTEKEYIELTGGHISVFSGRQAHQTLWPKINKWLSARSR